MSSGRPPFTGGCDEEILDFLALSAIDSASFEIAGEAAEKSAEIELGRIVMTGTPELTDERTVVDPPKTSCVAITDASTSTASVMIPESVATATRAATSLPNACDAIRSAFGAWLLTSWASASAEAATP